MPPVESIGDALEGPAKGERFLALLADARTLELMEAVRDASLERRELIARSGFEGSAFDRRIGRLTQMGLIVATAIPHDQRRKGYQLAHCGRHLLAIGREIELAAAHIDAQAELGTLLLKSVADPWDRAVSRVLLEAPHSFNDLLRLAQGTWRPQGPRRAVQLSATGLTMRLERLRQLGLVARRPAPRRGAVLYAPGEKLWRMGRVAALSALWRWHWTPQSVPRMAGDLSGLLKMLAPRVRVVGEAETRVVLHMLTPPGMGGWPDVVMCLTDGRVSVSELTLVDPDAWASAAPLAWYEALLGGDFDAIAIDGDTARTRAILTGLATVLRR